MNSNISDFITINLVFVGGAAADNYIDIEDISKKLTKKLESVCEEMKKKPYLIEEAKRIADIIAKIRQNVMSDSDWIDVIEIINNEDEDNTITFTRNVPRFEHSDNTITFTGNMDRLDNSDNTITFSATLREVEGDGNCMFSAISASLEQKGIYIPHSSLREMAINYIGARYTKEELANLIRSSDWAGLKKYGYLTNNDLAIKYLEVMENTKPSGSDKNSYIWGGDIEIGALQELLETKIHVVRSRTNEVENGNLPQNLDESLFIYFTGQHYDSLINVTPTEQVLDNEMVPDDEMDQALALSLSLSNMGNI